MATPEAPATPHLAARLGLFDATMVVMGGIIGSGIFINPYVVARKIHAPGLILLAWAFGGAIALAGAFVYAELTARRPAVGGQYAYLREALHPLLGFLFGWALLLVINPGASAAVAMACAHYIRELTGTALPPGAIAAVVITVFTGLNCLGVTVGGRVQSTLMVLKVALIAALVGAGLFTHSTATGIEVTPSADLHPLLGFGAAMVPISFAYGGYQTSTWVGEEIRDARRTLPRAILLGVVSVLVVYLTTNLVYLRVLGPSGLAATETPASAVMQRALGGGGAELIAFGIVLSTLGWSCQIALTGPRVYYAMARDGVFFAALARLNRRTLAPVAAIVLQGALALVVALTGTFERILSYVIAVDVFFLGLTAACVFIFRQRDTEAGATFRTPGHPWTTLFYVAAQWAITLATVYSAPVDSLIGVGIVLAGIPVFLLWRARTPAPETSP